MAEPITNVLGTVAIKHRGEYDEEAIYEKLNVVSYNGSSYCAKGPTQGNLPTDEDFWELMAEKGDKGDTGEEGYTPIKGTDYYTAEDKAELESTLSSDVHSEVSTQVGTLTSATPLAAASTAGMTDTTRVYVNTTDGNWYWYDGDSWEIGGQYLSSVIDNLYTELLFGSTNSFSFNTTNNTVTIGACRFIFKQQMYDITSSKTVNIPTTGTSTVYLYYDTTDSTFKIRGLTVAPNSTDAIVLIFSRTNLTKPNLLTYKGRYTVDGAIYNDNYINNQINFIPIANKPLFEFDTVNNNLKVNELRVYNNRTGGSRDISPITLDYSSVSSTVVALAYDFDNSQLVVDSTPNLFNKEQYGIIMVFHKSISQNKDYTTYKGEIIVDGKGTGKYIEDSTIYISGEGDDSTGDGTKTNPYKTIGKAMSLKPRNLFIYPGIYEATTTNVDWEIYIKSVFNNYDIDTNPIYKKPIICFGKTLEPDIDGVTGLLKVSYASTSSDNIYKVFVSKELPIETTGSRPSYTVTLWLSDLDNEINDLKLLPVLTLQDCIDTENSFFYDGNDIYINDVTDFGNKLYVLSTSDITNKGFTFDKATVNNISFRYSYTANVLTSATGDVTFNDCDFGNSAASDGIQLDKSNAYLYNCNAYKNRNDGFNIHSFGVSHFYNCNGYYNWDDGISHHDGTIGYIEGGEWHHNGKGGISSPTYGSTVNVTGAYSHDNNQYGILAYAENPVNGNILISNCVLKNNLQFDLNNRNYSIVMYNTVYDTKQVSGSGTVTEF